MRNAFYGLRSLSAIPQLRPRRHLHNVASVAEGLVVVAPAGAVLAGSRRAGHKKPQTTFSTPSAPFTTAPAAAAAKSGCQKCGLSNWKKTKRTTGAGWGLFVVGLLLAPFTLGLTLVLCVLAFFLTQRGWKCNDCKYTWSE